jgi:hypothetical protein
MVTLQPAGSGPTSQGAGWLLARGVSGARRHSGSAEELCILSMNTCAPQVGQRQSSMRQVQVGGAYSLPVPARGLAPMADQPFAEWRDTVSRGAQQVCNCLFGFVSICFIHLVHVGSRHVAQCTASELRSSVGEFPSG